MHNISSQAVGHAHTVFHRPAELNLLAVEHFIFSGL